MENNEYKPNTLKNNSTQTETETIKVKRKRTRKRNRNKSSSKVENLISKTFQEKIQISNNHQPENSDNKLKISNQNTTEIISMEKSREEIMAARSAKKAAKQHKQLPENTSDGKDLNTVSTNIETNQLKNKDYSSKNLEKTTNKTEINNITSHNVVQVTEKGEKNREKILAEREAKKLAKQAAKQGKQKIESNNLNNVEKEEILCNNLDKVKISIEEAEKKPALSKAERRAIQEAQRAAKLDKTVVKQPVKKIELPTLKSNKISSNSHESTTIEKLNITKINTNDYKIKLFNHLDGNFDEKNLFINNAQIHPAMVRLGEQYEKRIVVGSNARCIAFLNALKLLIKDYETPAKKEFARGLEGTIKNCVEHLNKCRPLAVSVINAHKCIKLVLTKLPADKPEIELKSHICEYIEIYIKDEIEKAALSISSKVQEKISNGDVILTFGCSSLINHILEEAHLRKIDFRVIVVDSRPFNEGQELLRRLVSKEISCTYVLINAIGFVMPDVTKVLMGAHALLANGYVMARTGTAQVALVARSFNVPVLVCCETHKFSERVQTDAIVFNELGNPNDLVISDTCKLANWKTSNSKLSPLNLNYDVTPPELVTAVVTEVAILPCTSVPVILRLRPTEIGY